MKELQTYELKLRQFNGHYDCVLTDKSGDMPCCVRVESPIGDLRDTETRRRLLDCFFTTIRDIIRGRSFPKDTLIYDTVEGVGGKRLTNPRYPDELPRHLKKDFGATIPGSDD
jgi:hypothetical protein